MTTDTAQVKRWFVGIGVGSYEDEALNLEAATSDVKRIGEWFTEQSGVAHEWACVWLGDSPKVGDIQKALKAFLAERTEDDVVVLWFAGHGEYEGARYHLFGHDTPAQNLAGASVDAAVLGTILGTYAPHNMLVVIDACVSGEITSEILFAASKTSAENANRDPHRRFAMAVLGSTFGRDPALDGRFATAFLAAVSQERWTGTDEWISIDQVIVAINDELSSIAASQVAERIVKGPGATQLIPNPNVHRHAQRRGLVQDEEFIAHFDPMSRGVARGELGSFFTGRTAELAALGDWLGGDRSRHPSDLLVITGQPGTGKSALLSRVIVDEAMSQHIGGVVWCHNKSAQIADEIEEIYVRSLRAALTTQMMDGYGQGNPYPTLTIAVDALDEATGNAASEVAKDLLGPLAKMGDIQIVVATRRRPIHGQDRDLLDELGALPADVLDLDQAPDRHADMRAYAEARLRERGIEADDAEALARNIVEAAGDSFLVTSIAARTVTAAMAGDAFSLPAGVGEALSGYLDATENPALARAVLRPLAWARGAGLPWGRLWPTIARHLAELAADGVEVHDDSIAVVLDEVGDLVVESAGEHGPVYRLFHEALAENLRSDTRGPASNAAVAAAMLELVRDRAWSTAPPYVLTTITSYLIDATDGEEGLDLAIEILTDASWDRAVREATGDPMAGATLARAAGDRLAAHGTGITRLMLLAITHSRAYATAPPLVLDVLARSGQMPRAMAMLGNLTTSTDLLLAHRLLAERNAEAGDLDAAAQLAEASPRLLSAIPHEHVPMAWYEVALASAAARELDHLAGAASQAVVSAGGLDDWDRPNGMFWAAMACRLGDDHDGMASIRGMLDESSYPDAGARRNQTLQTAAVTRHHGMLDIALQAVRDADPDQEFPNERHGNLALALADAGRTDDLDELVSLREGRALDHQPDVIKRWAWAMALSGRNDEALAALAAIRDPDELSQAIVRVADVAGERGDADLLKTLVGMLPADHDPRIRERSVRVRWQAGDHMGALAEAEEMIAAGHRPATRIDPRDGADVSPLGTKVGRRSMTSSVTPVRDAELLAEVAKAARAGDLHQADQLVATMTVPIYIARARAVMAEHIDDPAQAMGSWLSAVWSAGLVGYSAVQDLLPQGRELMARSSLHPDFLAERWALATRLDREWSEERFNETPTNL